MCTKTISLCEYQAALRVNDVLSSLSRSAILTNTCDERSMFFAKPNISHKSSDRDMGMVLNSQPLFTTHDIYGHL